MGKGDSPKQTQNQTTMPVVPQWLQDMAQEFLGAERGATFFGPGNYQNFNPATVPGVAPFTGTQLDAMQGMLGLGPMYEQGLGQIMGQMGGLGGQYGQLAGGMTSLIPGLLGLAPQFQQAGYMPGVGIDINMGQTPNMMNQYLPSYYQSASDQLVKQYRNATAPSQMSQAMLSGAFGGSADAEQRAMGQYSLGNNLADLAARMYEPAAEHQVDLQEQGRQFDVGSLLNQAIANYNFAQGDKNLGLQALSQIPNLYSGAGNMLTGAGNLLGGESGLLSQLPGLLGSMYYPYQVEAGVGQQQQQQLQNILNQAAQGAQMQQQYPFQILQNYGNALGSFMAPFTGSQATGTVKQSGGGGKL